MGPVFELQAKLGNLLHEAFEHWDAADDPEGAELCAQLWPRLIQSRSLLGHYRRQAPPPERVESANAREDLALLEQLRAPHVEQRQVLLAQEAAGRQSATNAFCY